MDTGTGIIAKHQTSTLPMSVHFDHAGQTLQVSGYTYSFRICRTNDMTQVESPKTRHAAPTILMRFLPDAHTLFLVFGDGSCCTWTPEDGSKTKNNAPTTSLIYACLLYTTAAVDDLTLMDIGARRRIATDINR